MADEKTFRYGFIILGFFLVMVGMFIMSVEKPQIYITFCALGVLTIAVGITWSMCQCYPKIRVISVDTETEKFLVKVSPAASTAENEKSSSQTPYTSQEEAEAYEKSLPSYEQIQMKVVGAAESMGVQSAPVLPIRAGECTQSVIQARADVHRNLESEGETYKDPAVSQREAYYCQSERFGVQAPLASFHEEVDMSSVESPSNSPFLQRFKDAPQFAPPTESRLRFKLPSYDDFALIDSLMGEGQDGSHEKTTAANQSNCSIPATARGDAPSADLEPEPLESRVKLNADEDDMYYGIK